MQQTSLKGMFQGGKVEKVEVAPKRLPGRPPKVKAEVQAVEAQLQQAGVLQDEQQAGHFAGQQGQEGEVLG